MVYDHALAVAIELASRAGALLRAEFERPGGPRGARGACPADVEAEALIRNALHEQFPAHGIVGEELVLDDRPARDDAQHVWVIDPNDGTSAFQRGWRGAAVSIGLLRAGRPVLGVVYAYAARCGVGDLIAWAEGTALTRNGVAVSPAWPAQLDGEATVCVSQGADGHAQANARLCAPARFRTVPGIAYRLALAAVGEAVAGVSLNRPVPWDVCGGHALLHGAGGELYRTDGSVVTYAATGRGEVGDCVGGHPQHARVLSTRDWRAALATPALPPRASPFDLSLPAAHAICADHGRLARAQGCLLGLLAGDNLGALVEFADAADIARNWRDGPARLGDGGVWRIAAGQPTDDGELALMLARSLVQSGHYDAHAVARAYLHWYDSEPFDIGTTIGRVLAAGAHALAAGSEPLDVMRDAACSGTSQANGALMRVAPLGLYGHALAPAELAALARADAALTHADPVCQDANAAYVLALAHAVGSGADAREVYDFALEWARAEAVEDVVEALAHAALRAPDTSGARSGWVLVALQNAFYTLLHADTPSAGVIATVRRGGDTDTNAAIAGALVGSVHGIEAWPAQWIDRVTTCRPLDTLPLAAHPRPREFWPVDALVLAERLLCARGAGA